MAQQQFVVNAFERGPYTGNPAAVVPLESWPEDALLQAIAEQNNLSETAFFVDSGERIALRWFTPAAEIELCGHATLATGHVLYAELGDQREKLVFDTLGGELVVERAEEGYLMDFPAVELDVAGEDDSLTDRVRAAAGVNEGEVAMGGGWPYLMLDSAEAVRSMEPDMRLASELPHGGFSVGAPGDAGTDIVARAFAPGVGIPEDPATGSVHCALVPYWGRKLGLSRLTSHQLSARGGYFTCHWREADGRVDLVGSCRTFSRGDIWI